VKVSVPFEFDMDERFGIALEQAGELRLASRDECRDWVQKHIADPTRRIKGTVAQIKETFEQPKKSEEGPPSIR